MPYPISSGFEGYLFQPQGWRLASAAQRERPRGSEASEAPQMSTNDKWNDGTGDG